MAEALDVSKRYYEQLKQKTYDQKQDKNKINIGCASLVQYMKKELQADAELDWNTLLEWISSQAKLETFERYNDIDDDNTSKQNNDVSDNNKGGNQNMSEEKDRGKGFDDCSSSDDDEDNNQNDDDRDDTNKEKVKGIIWEVESDEENEWNEQGSTDGDINKNDKSQDDNDAGDNDEEEGDSNEKKSGGTSDIRGDDDITDVDRTVKKKGRTKKRKRYR